MNAMPDSESAQGYRLGTGRPPLAERTLPTPEETFNLTTIGPKQLFGYVLGPSFIALGAAVGSGEWLLGPLAAGTIGFGGVFFIVLISVLLQTVFNYECARYTTATGEPAIAGWSRVPPGRVLWLPVALLLVLFAHIFGGWATAAGQSVFILFTGNPPAGDGEIQATRFIAIGLLVICLLIIVGAKRISRAFGRIMMVLMAVTLIGLLVADLLLVPASIWGEALAGIVTPQLPEGETSATTIGALAGYAGMTAGLNWLVLGHYRDRGYGMGAHTGFLSGGRGEQARLSGTGATFASTPHNAGVWRAWRRILRIEMWGIFAPFAVLGMALPSMLVAQLARTGEPPTEQNIPTYMAERLADEHGAWLGALVAILGTFVFLGTLLVIFEGIGRTIVDAAVSSDNRRLQQVVGTDARRLYFPVLIGFTVLIAIFIHLAVPTVLVQISGNLAAGCMLIFPALLIYLNRRLPAPARLRWPGSTVLVLNTLFFGTFFVNFVVEQVTGAPLFTL